MKRTFKYALTAVLGAVMVVPAVAQDNFPDVPENHWAFEALARMRREGVLVGYPDGLFRGGRPASRYELAVAINAAYTNLRNITDSLEQQIKGLDRPAPAQGPSKADLDNLRQALTQLQNEVKTLKGYGDDISNLKRLADTFQKELQALGVDVEAMKRDLGDLSDRVGRLEKRRPAVDISGDVNLLVLAGNSRDGRAGLDVDGRLNGVAGGGPVGLTRDLSILHEGAFTLAGTNESGPTWRGTLVVGNMLGLGAFPNQSELAGGLPYGEGGSDVYLQDFAVKFDTSLVGLKFNAEVGRVGYKVSPMMFQRIDNTSYYSNGRWDNGLYTFDGAILGFNFGAAKLDVFGGKNSNRFSVNGTDLNPIADTIQVDRSLGLNLNVPLTSNGNLNLAYLWLDSDATVGGINRVNVYGGSVNFGFGNLKLEGGYSATTQSLNSSNVVDTDNTAIYGKATLALGKLNLLGGYREIEANYVAPGDWGRLGILRNPTDVKSYEVGGSFAVNNALSISANGEFFESLSSAAKADKYAVNLGYAVNTSLKLNVGYEETRFENVVPGVKPLYRWITFGAGYGLSDSSKLSIQYQISDISNEFMLGGAATRFTGGLLSTQLSVKF